MTNSGNGSRRTQQQSARLARVPLVVALVLLLMGTSLATGTTNTVTNRRHRGNQHEPQNQNQHQKNRERVRGQFGQPSEHKPKRRTGGTHHTKPARKATGPRTARELMSYGKGKGGGNYDYHDDYHYHEEEYHYHSDSNIFDHPGQTMPVECGSATSPFLTTFITSIEFRSQPLPTPAPATAHSRSNKMSYKMMGGSYKSGGKGKGKGGSMMGGSMMSRYNGDYDSDDHYDHHYDYAYSPDGYHQDGIPDDYVTVPPVGPTQIPTEIAPNELTPTEERILQETFRDVYNQLAFHNCDGLFRTVFTSSLTLAEKENVAADGSYTVTLFDDPPTATASPIFTTNPAFTAAPVNTFAPANTFAPLTVAPQQTAQPDAIPASFTRPDGRQRRRLQEDVEVEGILPDSDLEDIDATVLQEHLVRELSDEGEGEMGDGMNTTDKSIPGDTRQSGSTWMSPHNYDDVDDNTVVVKGGDLLTIYYVSLTATCRNCRVTAEVNFPLLQIPPEELPAAEVGFTAATTPLSVISTAPVGDVCTCPAGSNEAPAYSRRLQTATTTSTSSLFVPPPHAPTAEEYIAAMNRAIANNSILRQRIVGLVQLVEPDYFNGRNPPRFDPNSPAPTQFTPTPFTPFPTVTPLTRPPTPFPTFSQTNQDTSTAFRGASTWLAITVTLVSSWWLLSCPSC